METKQKQGSRVCAALGGVFALGYVLLQLRSGGSLPEWLWFTGYTAAVILLPGCFWFETLGLTRRFSALRLPRLRKRLTAALDTFASFAISLMVIGILL